VDDGLRIGGLGNYIYIQAPEMGAFFIRHPSSDLFCFPKKYFKFGYK
jgi:hypothetical protein